MKNPFIEIVGWYGTIAILIAYGLLNFGILTPYSWTYLLLNLTGAVGILIDAMKKKDYQPVVLNVIWSVIAISAMIKLFL